MKPIALAVLLGAIATGARAEHRGPVGDFPGQKPEEVSAKIAAVCAGGGFAVRRYSPTDLACQGSDFAGGTSEFRNGGLVDDPASRPQAYHRFIADASPSGTVVHERSQIVMTLGNGQLHAMDALGLSAVKFNARVRALYAAVQSLPGVPGSGAHKPADTAPAPVPQTAAVPTPSPPQTPVATETRSGGRGWSSSCIRVLTDPRQNSC